MALALAALLSAASPPRRHTAAAAGARRPDRLRLRTTPRIKTVEGDGTRGKTAFDRRPAGARLGGAEAARPRVLARRPQARLALLGRRLRSRRAGSASSTPTASQGRPLIVAEASAPALRAASRARPGRPTARRSPSERRADGALHGPARPAARRRRSRCPRAQGARRARLLARRPPARLQRARRRGRPPRLRQEPRERRDHASSRPAAAARRCPAFSPDGATVAYVEHAARPGRRLRLPAARRPPARRRRAGHPLVQPGRAGPLRHRPPRLRARRHPRSPSAVTKPGDRDCAGDLMVVNTDGAAEPARDRLQRRRAAVDWAVRTAQGVNKLMSALPGSDREGGDGDAERRPSIARERPLRVLHAPRPTNLAAGVNDDNGKPDIFRRDLASRQDRRWSAPTRTARVADGESDLPVVDADGDYVAFRSTARDLVGRRREAATNAVWLRTVRQRLHGARLAQPQPRQRRRARRQPPGRDQPRRPLRPLLLDRRPTSSATQGETRGHDVDLFVFDINDAARSSSSRPRPAAPIATGNGGDRRARCMSDDGQHGRLRVHRDRPRPRLRRPQRRRAEHLQARPRRPARPTLVDGARAARPRARPARAQLQGLSARRPDRALPVDRDRRRRRLRRRQRRRAGPLRPHGRDDHADQRQRRQGRQRRVEHRDAQRRRQPRVLLEPRDRPRSGRHRRGRAGVDAHDRRRADARHPRRRTPTTAPTAVDA